MKRYRLASSLADRIHFDEHVRMYARDCARAADVELDDEMLATYREYFLAALDDVDDVEEARARFDAVFRAAWDEALQEA